MFVIFVTGRTLFWAPGACKHTSLPLRLSGREEVSHLTANQQRERDREKKRDKKKEMKTYRGRAGRREGAVCGTWNRK